MKLLFLIFLLIASIKLSSAAESDDVALARELEREARDLCGAGCDRLADFGALQAKTGDAEASKKSFSAAWDAAAKLESSPERRMALSGTAQQQAQSRQIKEAIAASQRLTSRYEQAMTLGAIAIVQADIGEEKAALKTVDLIPAEEVSQRNSTLVVVAMNLSKRHDFSGASRILNLIPSDDELAEKILTGDVPWEQLSPQEKTAVDPAMMRSSTLVFIAEDQAEAGNRKLAHQTALGIRIQRYRDAGLSRVACIAADSGDLAVAQAALKGIGGQEPKEHALVRIVAAMAKLGQFKEARNLLGTIQDPSAKANAFFEMAASAAAHGEAKAARSFVEDAMSLKPSAKDVQNAAKMIVTSCLTSRNLELAEAFTRDVHDPATLSEALQAIAVANWQLKKVSEARRFFDESRQAAENVSESYYRCIRLRELALAQFEAGERGRATTAIELALASARKIEIGGGTDVIALTETATTRGKVGDRDGAAASFKVARDAAARYPEESYVAQLLQDVAMAQARAGDVEAAIQAARQQNSALSRSCMLVGVANAILSRSDTTP